MSLGVNHADGQNKAVDTPLGFGLNKRIVL